MNEKYSQLATMSNTHQGTVHAIHDAPAGNFYFLATCS